MQFTNFPLSTLYLCLAEKSNLKTVEKIQFFLLILSLAHTHKKGRGRGWGGKGKIDVERITDWL